MMVDARTNGSTDCDDGNDCDDGDDCDFDSPIL